MFGIDFTEFMVIGVIALIVLGPERLPKAAKTVGQLLSKAQRYVNNVKSDIRREIDLTELDRIKKDMEGAAQSLKNTVTSNVAQLESSVQEASQSLQQTVVTPIEQAQKSLSLDPNEFEASIAQSTTTNEHSILPPALKESADTAELNQSSSYTSPNQIISFAGDKQPGEEGFLTAQSSSLPPITPDKSLYR